MFILEFCRVHISKTKLAMAMKFRGWLQLGVRRAYLATICLSCLCLQTPLPFPKQVLVFMFLQYKSFEYNEGKGERVKFGLVHNVVVWYPTSIDDFRYDLLSPTKNSIT